MEQRRGWRPVLVIGLLWGMIIPQYGQGYLHADGKKIVNGEGEEVILRGIGTGNWMLQEGYMMQTDGVAGTQHEFRARLTETIGEARTDSFYTAWLASHCTRTDIDSMASWGFNCVRAALHYKWFTPPIEEEPVEGEITWLETGFTLVDSLLDWCGDNGMYLILDMHGAPGGQGKNADISDYDPAKPSLWESDLNKDKLVALWQKLAERYADEPWIGGYDLINETNWTFPEGNNSQLRDIYERITDSIRAVDPNHILFIEGNSFANDFSGLTPPWDDNMVYSFHKYWNYNHPGALDWVLPLRDNHNVPLWLGETGENSNTWFTNLIALSEGHGIGWSWWPLKKGSINNPLRVEINEDYDQLVDSWRGTAPALDTAEAFQAVMTFAERHHISRCTYQKDVVDAMMRQPYSTETLPYVGRTVNDVIFASEYDLGRNGYAYFDTDTANYSGEPNVDYRPWNTGWSFRNDGVDIEPDSKETVSNGYTVGWTSDGEWLQYTLENDSVAAFTLEIRSASAVNGSRIRLEVNGSDATGPVRLPGTGGWYTWATTEFEGVILPAGTVRVRLVFDQAGSNLNYLRFKDSRSVDSVDFRVISATTEPLGNRVLISLNKAVTGSPDLSVDDFSLIQGSEEVALEKVQVSSANPRLLEIYATGPLFYDRTLRVSYAGDGILNGVQALEAFSDLAVNNRLARHFEVPGRIEAEDFYDNFGLELEVCQDAGGGQNTGYAHVGDYLDYVVYVKESGTYAMDFRVATENHNGALSVQQERDGAFQELIRPVFIRTGGWQNWNTQSFDVELEEGKYRLRLLVTGSEHNLNWFEFSGSTAGTGPVPLPETAILYPNPATGRVTVNLGGTATDPVPLRVWNVTGGLVARFEVVSGSLEWDVSHWAEGIYFVEMAGAESPVVLKLVVEQP